MKLLKRIRVGFWVVFLVLLLLLQAWGGGVASSGTVSSGKILYKQAKALDNRWEFTKAEQLYKKARKTRLGSDLTIDICYKSKRNNQV